MIVAPGVAPVFAAIVAFGQFTIIETMAFV
jgi:hypothetical protein